MTRSLILVANPGSASRKYALFDNTTEKARIHFEWADEAICYTLTMGGKNTYSNTSISSLEEAISTLPSLLKSHGLMHKDEKLSAIALRVAAPGEYFMHDHKIDAEFIAKLEQAKKSAPLHAEASLNELAQLQRLFPDTATYGISDSAFHSTKPEEAWNYGISLELADRLELKRFGYHGISIASVLAQTPLPGKLLVCHLGSGASVTAVQDGISIDTTMGYSPLEGLIMSTRSGSLDIGAALRLKGALELSDDTLETYLNTEGGLLGLGGSSDIRELLRREHVKDHRAHLALDTYIYSVQKGIGQMAAALDGVDALVFTGTVGERAAVVRERIVAKLGYLGFFVDRSNNASITSPEAPVTIQNAASKPIYILPTKEEDEIAKRTLMLLAA